VKRSDQESSQRSRGFLYLMTGLAATVLSTAPKLQVCENGVGAINLRYAGNQLSVASSRAMHPFTLALFTQLTTLLVGVEIQVWNTGLWKTKAELFRRLVVTPAFENAVRLSVTCDRFPRTTASKPCGSCTSCLYRRASLHAVGTAGFEELGSREYSFDPLSPNVVWTGHNRVPLFAIEFQVARLRSALGAPDPIRALIPVFPEISLMYQAWEYLQLSNEGLADQIVRLFRAYVQEWQAFSAMIAWPGTSELDFEPAGVAELAS
jgi:hypothetical protein